MSLIIVSYNDISWKLSKISFKIDQEQTYSTTDIFAGDRMPPMNKSYEKLFQALINDAHRVTGFLYDRLISYLES